MTNFRDLGLDEELLQALEKMGFEQPTEIQEKAIPHLLKDNTDFVGLAQTGTGKTAAFGLPLLHKINQEENHIQALILSPTRELGIQIGKELKNFSSKKRKIKVATVYGGASIDKQRQELRSGPQIVVATPGRLIDMIERGYCDLSRVKIAVLDEADEMLNMGFIDDINTILEETPEEKQTWLFSATMPNEVARISKRFMENPVEVTVGNRNQGNENIDHQYYLINGHKRFHALKRLIDASPGLYAIVFCKTKRDTQTVADKLIEAGYPAAALHGDLSQSQRETVMHAFRNHSAQVLCATDVAARGLDVKDITHVIHYQLPDDVENYTHRSGRTARAGKLGVSMALVTRQEGSKIPVIQRIIKNVIHKKSLPTRVDVVERKLAYKLDHLGEVKVEEEFLTRYWDFISARLEAFSREDLIKKMLSLEFGDLWRSVENEEDFTDSEPDRHNKRTAQRYFCSVGAKDGFTWQMLKDLLVEELKINRAELSGVDSKDSFSFFTYYGSEAIPASFVYNGMEIRIDPAKPERGGRNKDGFGGGGFKGKRGGGKFSDKGGFKGKKDRGDFKSRKNTRQKSR